MGEFIIKKNKTEQTTVISLRIDKELLQKYDDLANKANVSRNEVMAKALKYSLDNLKFIEED